MFAQARRLWLQIISNQSVSDPYWRQLASPRMWGILERPGLTRKDCIWGMGWQSVSSQWVPLSPAVSSTRLLRSSWCTQRGSKLLSQMQNDSPGKLIRFIDNKAKAWSGDVLFPGWSTSLSKQKKWTSESRQVIKVSFHSAGGNSPRTW